MPLWKIVMVLAVTNEFLRHANLLLFNSKRLYRFIRKRDQSHLDDPDQYPPYSEVFPHKPNRRLFNETVFRSTHPNRNDGPGKVPPSDQA